MTVGDMVADPLDCIAAVDRKIFIEQLHAALDEALNRLPQEQSRAIRRRFYEGLTFAKAAELSRTTPDTVRKREAAAMQQLRRKKVPTSGPSWTSGRRSILFTVCMVSSG